MPSGWREEWEAESERAVGGGKEEKEKEEQRGKELLADIGRERKQSGIFRLCVCIQRGRLQGSGLDQSGHVVKVDKWTHTQAQRRVEGHRVAGTAKQWSPLTPWHRSWR